MGYVFNQWAEKYGAVKAVCFTSLLRLIVHTYQGTEHLLPIAFWSILFGVWYYYARKLWPLIFAHFLIDLLSLGLFKAIYGSPS
jgi:membrane protease YdiL (CAAX protease family)